YAFGARQQQREQVGLVVVRVDDVDAAFAHQLAQRRPDGDIEGTALGDFHVVDAEPRGAFGDAEGAVAGVADVAHRDGKAPVGALRAEQNGLLRSAAGAADAAQLENTDGFGDHEFVTRSTLSTESPACAARLRVAAALMASLAQAPTTDQS